MPDEIALGKAADAMYGEVLPIAAGLADSYEEVNSLTTDQFLLLRKLSEKVIEMKGQATAKAIGELFKKSDSSNTDNPLSMEMLMGKE